jgi:hypothetical protein
MVNEKVIMNDNLARLWEEVILVLYLELVNFICCYNEFIITFHFLRFTTCLYKVASAKFRMHFLFTQMFSMSKLL